METRILHIKKWLLVKKVIRLVAAFHKMHGNFFGKKHEKEIWDASVETPVDVISASIESLAKAVSEGSKEISITVNYDTYTDKL